MTQRKREKELKCAIQKKAGTRTQNVSPRHGIGDRDSWQGTCLSGIKEMLKPKEEPLGGAWNTNANSRPADRCLCPCTLTPHDLPFLARGFLWLLELTLTPQGRG